MTGVGIDSYIRELVMTAITPRQQWLNDLANWEGKPMPYPASTPHIDIVFDGPPEHKSGGFIEVENAMGQSICFGKWVQREDGYWVLRITKNDCSFLGVS